MGRKAGFRWFVFILAWLVIAVGQSQAVTVALADGNSVAQFQPDSQAGQFNWFVDGTNQLAQQWFWYRIGPNGPESPINTISAPTINQPDASDFSTQYDNGAHGITIGYSLIGGSAGSGTSDLSEQIRIVNHTGAPLDYHFFEYVDLDLAGTPNDTRVLFTNLNTARQEDGLTVLSETVDTITGAATTHREVNFFNATLVELNDGLPTTLNDNLGPIGPGDLTWAFEWDFNIPAFGSALISKDKNLAVPEPSALILLAVSACLVRRRRLTA